MFDKTISTETAKRQVIGGEHYRELHILFVDGSVQSYKDWKLTKEELEDMCNIE